MEKKKKEEQDRDGKEITFFLWNYFFLINTLRSNEYFETSNLMKENFIDHYMIDEKIVESKPNVKFYY